MSTRLATQRQFIISSSSASAEEAAKSIQLDSNNDEERVELELVSKTTSEDVLTVVERHTPSPVAASHGEQFEFCTEDGVVVAATLEDVMTQVAYPAPPTFSVAPSISVGFSLQNCQLLQKKLSEGIHDDVDDVNDDHDDAATTVPADQLEVIRVVLPMDTSDSSQEAAAHLHAHLHAVSSSDAATGITTNNNNDTIHHTLPGLAAIKGAEDLAQQVANGQLTVVQTSEDDEGTPFITVTGEWLHRVFFFFSFK